MVEIEDEEDINQHRRANGLLKLALVMAFATPFVRSGWINRVSTLALGLIGLLGALWTSARKSNASMRKLK